eukprot:SAG22_NODE_210_length_15092_cov_81.740946_9_plen_212_part_00
MKLLSWAVAAKGRLPAAGSQGVHGGAAAPKLRLAPGAVQLGGAVAWHSRQPRRLPLRARALGVALPLRGRARPPDHLLPHHRLLLCAALPHHHHPPTHQHHTHNPPPAPPTPKTLSDCMPRRRPHRCGARRRRPARHGAQITATPSDRSCSPNPPPCLTRPALLQPGSHKSNFSRPEGLFSPAANDQDPLPEPGVFTSAPGSAQPSQLIRV